MGQDGRRCGHGGAEAHDHVGGPGPDRGAADSHAAGHARVAVGYVGGGLFVADEFEFDGRTDERVQDVGVAVARNAENVFDAVPFKGVNQNASPSHAGPACPCLPARVSSKSCRKSNSFSSGRLTLRPVQEE